MSLRKTTATLATTTLGGALVLVLGTASAGRAMSLTGLTLFSTDSSGNTDKIHYWNTIAGDISYNLWVGTGSLSAPTLINGPTNQQAAINLSLTPGTHTFNLYGDPGADPTGFFGLNLFFNGNNSNPGISALLRSNTISSALAANRGSTFALNISPVSGVGSLTFGTGENDLVTLTSAYWQTQNNFMDIVAPYGVGPSGAFDFVGQITLTVGRPRQTSVPEPSSLSGLLALGLLGLGLGVSRRLNR